MMTSRKAHRAAVALGLMLCAGGLATRFATQLMAQDGAAQESPETLFDDAVEADEAGGVNRQPTIRPDIILDRPSHLLYPEANGAFAFGRLRFCVRPECKPRDPG